MVLEGVFKKKIIVHLRGGSLSLNVNVNRLQKFVITTCIQMADKIIVLGEKEFQFIKSFYGVIESDKIFILPNAVEIPELDSEYNVSIKKDKGLNIVFIGRLDKDKGLEEILQSLRNILLKADFHFFIAGAGPDQEWFIRKCANLIGENYTYLGVLNNLEKKSFYESADIFLLPSYFEGLPNALLEAMAYGVVPIVTRVGSISEVIIDGNNGFFVPLRDHKSISEILVILNNDRALLKSIEKAAHITMLSNYSIVGYIAKLNSLYSTLN